MPFNPTGVVSSVRKGGRVQVGYGQWRASLISEVSLVRRHDKCLLFTSLASQNVNV